MNESENNFESLRRLLALKRHEVPPPGYFHQFSGNVVARLRAGETAERESGWVRFLKAFELKPAFAGVFASALCLLLIFGIVFVQRPDDTVSQSFFQPTSASAPMPAFASVSPVAMNQPGIIVSTNPVYSLQPAASLFGQQDPSVQQVSFTPAGN